MNKLTQKDFDTMWSEIRDGMVLTEEYSKIEWDDTLGFIPIHYSTYEFKGHISVKDELVWFWVNAKSENEGVTFYDVEILDFLIKGEDDTIFNGWDDINNRGCFYKMEAAFDKAANKIH